MGAPTKPAPNFPISRLGRHPGKVKTILGSRALLTFVSGRPVEMEIESLLPCLSCDAADYFIYHHMLRPMINHSRNVIRAEWSAERRLVAEGNFSG